MQLVLLFEKLRREEVNQGLNSFCVAIGFVLTLSTFEIGFFSYRVQNVEFFIKINFLKNIEYI